MLASSFENKLGLFTYPVMRSALFGLFAGAHFERVTTYVPDLKRNIMLEFGRRLAPSSSLTSVRQVHTPAHAETALSIRRRFHCVRLSLGRGGVRVRA